MSSLDPKTPLLVKWLDSFGAGAGWTEYENLGEDVEILCTSVGYPIKETETYVLIVPHIHGELEMEGIGRKVTACGCGEMAIPKVAIKEMTPLRYFVADEDERLSPGVTK